MVPFKGLPILRISKAHLMTNTVPSYDIAMSSQTTLYAIMTAGKGVMLALGSTVRFLGAAFLTMMPYIGMALAAFLDGAPEITVHKSVN